MKKTITIYSAGIIEEHDDHHFCWSLVAETPEGLAKKVEAVLAGEESEQDIVIAPRDMRALEAAARYGCDGIPESFAETDNESHVFFVMFSGRKCVSFDLDPAAESCEEEPLMAPPAGKEEIVDIRLIGSAYPTAHAAKIEELVEQGAFATENEAESWLRRNPITLELIYEKDSGLFAVESEAVESGGIVSPYTKKPIVTPED